MMPRNRVTVTIVETQEDDPPEVTTTRITREFDGPPTRDDVLRVFEAALRGAGYQCEHEALMVDDGPEPPR